MRKTETIAFRITLIVCIGLAIWGMVFFSSLSVGLRKAIFNDETVSLEKKVENVSTLVELERKGLLEYIEYLQHHEKFDINDSAEINEMLSHTDHKLKLANAAVFDLNSNVLFSIHEDSFGKSSEKAALSDALSGESSAKITVKNSSIMVTAAGRLPLKSGNAVVLLQKVISTSEMMERYSLFLDAEITFFIDDLRVATSLKNTDGKFMVGTKLNNDKIYSTVYSSGEKYRGRNNINGRDFLTSYQRFQTDDKDDKVMLFAGVNLEHIEVFVAKFYSVVVPVILVMVILLVLLLLIAININVLKPIQQGVKAFELLNGVDGLADLTYRIDIKRNNEIGTMYSEINEFIDKQQDIVVKMKETSETLSFTGETLATSSQQSAGAVSEIMANIASVKSSVEKQSEALGIVQSTIEESLMAFEDLDNLIKNNAAEIIESSAAIEEMVGNIGSVSNSVEKMAGEFGVLLDITEKSKKRQDDVANQIVEMAAQSAHLAEANNVISNIANQTNLLAMNAAIEAAHAGESGKGFSVVADEIRKLAESSSAQSKSIKMELDNITGIINSIVESSKLSVEDFAMITEKVSSTNNLVHEIDAAMTEQNEASQQVLTALKEMNDSTVNVQSTSKVMFTAAGKVKEETDNLEIISHSVVGSMDEMSLGINDITQSTQHVSDMATSTQENIESIEKILKQFKV